MNFDIKALTVSNYIKKDVVNIEELKTIAEELMYRKYIEGYQKQLSINNTSVRYQAINMVIEGGHSDLISPQEILIIQDIEARVLDEVIVMTNKKNEMEKARLKNIAKEEMLEEKRNELVKLQMQQKIESRKKDLQSLKKEKSINLTLALAEKKKMAPQKDALVISIVEQKNKADNTFKKHFKLQKPEVQLFSSGEHFSDSDMSEDDKRSSVV